MNQVCWSRETGICVQGCGPPGPGLDTPGLDVAQLMELYLQRLSAVTAAEVCSAKLQFELSLVCFTTKMKLLHPQSSSCETER